jgi:hypothetical protein
LVDLKVASKVLKMVVQWVAESVEMMGTKLVLSSVGRKENFAVVKLEMYLDDL